MWEAIQRYKSIIKSALICITLNILFRLLFLYLFKDDIDFTFSNFLYATFLGIKFDIRLTLILFLPIFIAHFFIKKSPKMIPKFSAIWATLVALIFTIFHILNIGSFSYLKIGVNSTLLKFLDNIAISTQMMFQSYPVFPIAIGLFLFIFSTYKTQVKIFSNKSLNSMKTKKLVGAHVLFFFLGAILIYGKMSYYPLRWSEAFFSGSPTLSFYCINPISYFFNTLKFKNTSYDIEKVKKYYPVISKYLNVDNPNIEDLNFKRTRNPKAMIKGKPNIIHIILESVASHKSSVFGNPLDPTPYLKDISQEGLFFPNFFTPSQATARSMFTSVTGLPDLSRNKTATRNPLIINQHSIINSFTDHKKLYFIGGSANWGNIRGVFSNNIDDLTIYEEGSFQSDRTDVWGLSDYDLFIEAHQVFKKQDPKKPFYAVIQSASFHRPYTIPDKAGDFKTKETEQVELSKYGFINLKEYNSIRFQDYAFGNFLKLAKESDYFKNTIFVIHGDHGLPHQNASHITESERYHNLVNLHVPFIIYGPKLIEPSINKTYMSQLDVLPSLASLLGIPYTNTTLGRDIFTEKKDKGDAFLFFWYETPPLYGIINDQYYLSTRNDEKSTSLFKHQSESFSTDNKKQHPETFKEMKDLSHGLYETGKYMMYHNNH